MPVATAIVVGSGPNGLAAAITLAQQDIDVTVLEAADRIGGGTRTSENTLPGLLHDDCAAVIPIALASPFFKSLDLESHGLEWAWPEIDLAHPLDGGRAGVQVRSLEETEHLLGADGVRWRRVFEPYANGFDDLADDVLRPLIHVPRHPLRLAHFGPAALIPATTFVRLWRTDEARALFAGNAAHGWGPLSRPPSSAFAVMFGATVHSYGWPVAKGGSMRIADALQRVLIGLGGKIETGRRVQSLAEVRGVDIVMFDLTPSAVVDIAGDALPQGVRRAYSRYRFGPGAFKIDFAVEGGVPWTNEHCRSAGTVHVCGSFDEVVAAERATNAGRMPERPFIVAAQQYLADPSRSVGNVHPFYAYAHVPHGYAGDATEAMIRQIERFAPGFRERIVGSFTRSTGELSGYNANIVGGDVMGGAPGLGQMVARPKLVAPYSTGIPGMYLCSASTPPGAGPHGMCGHLAAERAVGHLRRR
jgi:phytoene dehydrogenase-like protein